jgi:hypothetical protein
MLYYTINIDPEFVDNRGEIFTPKPTMCTFLFSNGTQVNASLPATLLAPLGSFSIVNVVWRDVEVLKREVTTYLDSNTIWKPRVQCLLPTDLKINLNTGTSVIGFKVEITGNATCNGLGLVNVPILLSYSVTKGETWNEITQAYTSIEGHYSAVWMPSATGNYLVNASWSGDSTYPSAKTTVNLAVTPFEEQSVFSVTSNSTLSTIVYDSTNREFSFTVTGPEGSSGYVDARIARSYVGNSANIKVYVDGNQTDRSVSSTEESWLFHFTYSHSTRTVIIKLSAYSPLPFDISLENLIGIVAVTITIICIGTGIYFLRKRRQQNKNASAAQPIID